ncbi:hypothetical protein RRG08_029059 [Elysia crispata]|uniref:Uncharacterized protein n=1 Tax=Elysia crispata TaxID=231223 RepID=A0AAE1DHK0_9GAST|nr:hypothetical protein RRG08_029059 [Elysia crispata]
MLQFKTIRLSKSCSSTTSGRHTLITGNPASILDVAAIAGNPASSVDIIAVADNTASSLDVTSVAGNPASSLDVTAVPVAQLQD